MSTDGEPPRKSWIERLVELGPAWITAISGLLAVLFTAGFFVGRSTGSPRPTAQPVKTVTVTANPSPASSADSASPAANPPASDGTLLGSYTVRLPQDGSAPLGAAAPTQAQILSGGGDVIWQTELGGSPLGVRAGDQILSLPSGATPTYPSCKADTILTNSMSNNPGTAFCIIETTGKMAGVTVQSVNLQQPTYIVLHVSVWANSP